MTRRLLDYGEHAVLLECADLGEALGLMPQITDGFLPQLTQIVPGARTLLLELATPLTPDQRQLLLELQPRDSPPDDQAPLGIEVYYDGDDLDEVARLTGLSPDAVVRTHTGQIWTVGFCGFAPGFAYLMGQNDQLRVPRRASPRTRVPAGAVGLADQWSGIYPRDGPGGWQLIGRTATSLWDLARTPPALLQPGQRVQFIAAGGQ